MNQDNFSNGIYEALVHPTETSIETLLLNIYTTRCYVNVSGYRYKIYNDYDFNGEYIKYKLFNNRRVRIYSQELRRRA